MARHWFGGTSADQVVSAYRFGNRNLVALAPFQRVTFWDAELDGARYLDLLDAAGTATQHIDADEHGYEPRFQGPPDGVPGMWQDTGDGSPRRFILASDPDLPAALYAARDQAAASEAAAELARDEIVAIGPIKAVDPSLVPLFVHTLDLARSNNVAPGVRTGLPSTQHTVIAGDGVAAAQGYTTENVATGVTGTAGTYTLTVIDTTTLTTIAGGTALSWAATVVDGGTGQAFPIAVLSIDGGTVNIAQPLPINVTAGTLSSWTDAAGGQHLTRAGYKAMAQHVAAANPLMCARGGIIEGQWDTLPQAYRALWARNTALTAYGVSNSASPIVQTSLQAQAAMNVYDTNGVIWRPNTVAGGARVGTHTSGHGAVATIRTGRRDAVVEFYTQAERVTAVTTARMQVTATTPDGTVLYDRTVGGSMRVHRVPVSGVDYVTLAVTNTDGGIYYLNLGQMTVREAGTAPVLRPKKALLLGDSWTQFYGHLLGDELETALRCEVATFGKGGVTTDWGIAWLDTALAANPGCDTVIVHFYTNDLNNNQSTTMTIPGGATVSMWPNGLTTAQARARWVSQIGRLVSMIQQRGLRPVVIGPGGANYTGQFEAAIRLEAPRLIDWNATAAELADTTAYVNTVGKVLGAKVMQGTATMTAAGPNPGDVWQDVNGTALFSLEKASLPIANYLVATGVTIGTDSNSDGLSDGFATQDVGVLTGDTYTFSIVSGNQRVAAAYGTGNGANGVKRIRMNATVVAGRDYLALFDIINATASADFNNSASDISGTAVGLSAANGGITVNASGAGQVYHRATAASAASRYIAIARSRTEGGAHTYDVRRVAVVDLTALFADYPNLSSRTTAELVSLVVARLG